MLSSERVLLSDLREALLRSGASDLELRDARNAVRGLEESFLLVVVGEFNSGKSSLLNALLGAEVLKEGVTPTTDKVSILVHGPTDQSAAYDGDEFVQRRTLPLEFLSGVALVDTPGTNAVIERHQVITEGFLPRADLLLFLTSADRAFTASERRPRLHRVRARVSAARQAMVAQGRGGRQQNRFVGDASPATRGARVRRAQFA